LTAQDLVGACAQYWTLGGCPTKLDPAIAISMRPEPEWKRRALAIEFWLATAVVGGSFIAGLVAAIRYLIG
jgi:hypothetical protein